MNITVIGCYGAYPEPNGATSGYLIEYGNTKVLIDCGSGVAAKLQNYIQLFELDAVVFSHYHRDHCADLECMQYGAMIDMFSKRRKQPLVMWGGEDKTAHINLSFGAYCIGKTYLEHQPFIIGDLSFVTQANVHEIPSFSIKVSDPEGAVMVYSGDTGYYDGLTAFAEDAGCFICESSLYAYQKGKVWGHLSSSETGIIAASAKVQNLVLTHFPHYGDLRMLVKEAEEYFDGRIVLAHPGMVIRT